ncbi:UDP-N-acetylmuramate--L-alanine ligase [Candidatus Dependentiae bacterium]|nr:UDP-N-acetylmuramate--L-alanine ligase [Candidatus Dependentiae bacterium]
MYRKGHIHFVGIGGIGMSGIAKILRYQGYKISGCDQDTDQKSVEDLTKIGCQVFNGNNSPLCQSSDVDVLVYSSAIKPDNPEIKWAQEKGIPTIPRALMLAELMRTKYSIAITGAHGKTTTTSMISHILIESHKDPTVIIGGHLHSISANARLGMGDFLVAEADESDRSLLRLYPTLAVVTNIDLEHLETYKDLDDIKQTFKEFLANIPFYGKAILCIDDLHIQSILPLEHIKTIKYGLDSKLADYFATDIELFPEHSTFILHHKNEILGKIKLNIPGKHNILNSLAAIAVCLDLDVEFKKISQALANFKGVDRRFTFKGTYKGAELFDDYGHHPTEIENIIPVAKRRAKNKLIVIFQPQRFIRTIKLWHNFIETFYKCEIDHLIITDIHPGPGEAKIENVTSEQLVEELKKRNPKFVVQYVEFDKNFEKIKEKLEPLIEKENLILTLGAGKLNKFADIMFKNEQ